jgi:hypothetical protein
MTSISNPAASAMNYRTIRGSWRSTYANHYHAMEVNHHAMVEVPVMATQLQPIFRPILLRLSCKRQVMGRRRMILRNIPRWSTMRHLAARPATIFVSIALCPKAAWHQ